MPPKRRTPDTDEEDAAPSPPKKMRQATLFGGTTSDAVKEWTTVDGTLMVRIPSDFEPRNKVAAFDLDDSLITTASGKKFSKNASDWKFLYPQVPKRLQELHSDGFALAVFSNQRGIGKGSTDRGEFCEKVRQMCAALKVPIALLVATGDDQYRKPLPGMWEHMKGRVLATCDVSASESFYVGDAAGRPEKWGPNRKKDFADTDRKFAANAGLPFKTPEEFFLAQMPAPFAYRGFDPLSVRASDVSANGVVTRAAPRLDPPDAPVHRDVQEMIVNVGYPASGKSRFSKTHLVPKGYVHINRDTLGTADKCVAEAKRALAAKKSVVIDNTNPDPPSRKRYVDLAKSAGVPVRCFYFETAEDHARHNNRFRYMVNLHRGDPAKAKKELIPDVAYHTFRKSLAMPSLAEGFESIVRVHFTPDFDNADHGRLYRMYLE